MGKTQSKVTRALGREGRTEDCLKWSYMGMCGKGRLICIGWQIHSISKGFTRNWKQLLWGREQDGWGIRIKKTF